MDKHEVFVTTPAIAYATTLAFAPFILILLSLLSLLGLDFHRKLSAILTSSFGEELGTAVREVLKNVDQYPHLSGLSGLFGLFFLFFSSSIVISQLRFALDKINEYKPENTSNSLLSFIRDKFWAIGLILVFAFLSIASLIITAVINALYHDIQGFLWLSVSYVINFLIFSFLFTAIYRYVPTRKQSWKNCFYSGLISTLFFLASKGLISWYFMNISIYGSAGASIYGVADVSIYNPGSEEGSLHNAAGASLYGAAGSLVVFLAWVYFTALILLMSYEISAHALKKTEPSV